MLPNYHPIDLKLKRTFCFSGCITELKRNIIVRINEGIANMSGMGIVPKKKIRMVILHKKLCSKTTQILH